MSQRQIAVPNRLETQLQRLRGQIRQLSMVRGLGLATVVLVTGLAISLFVDLQWQSAQAIRFALLGLVLASTLLVLWRSLLKPLLRRNSSVELAAIVEQAHPELSERLSSSIELSDEALPSAERGSPLMRELLMQQTLRQTGPIDFTDAVSPKRALRIAMAAALAVLLVLSPLLVSPSGYRLLLSRFFMPWGNFDSVGNMIFDVSDGDRVVARGSDVDISATIRWRLSERERPGTLWLSWQNSLGETDRRRMEYDETAEAYTTTIPHVFDTFDFDVSADAERSRTYDVDVVESPTVAQATLSIEPPAYTRMPAKTLDGLVGTITAFERSTLQFDLEFNKPVAHAALEWFDAESLDASVRVPQESLLELAEDGRSGRVTLSAEFSGSFSIRLTDEHGLHNTDDADRLLRLVVDQPPQVAFAGEQGILEARPGDVVPVAVVAGDDVGVGALELHFEIDGVRGETIPVQASALNGKSIDHEFLLDLSKLNAPHESVVAYRVRAADERVIPGNQEVWTDSRNLTINKNALGISEQSVAARQRAMKEELEAIRKDLQTNREQVQTLKKDAEADLRMQLEFSKAGEVAPRSLEQLDLAARVEQLASRFEEQPLYRGLAEQAQVVSREQLPETSEHLKTADDVSLKEKPAVFDENTERLQASEQKLAEISREFEQLAQIETDLLELQRLAERARELADDAMALDQQRRDTPRAETPEQQQRQDSEFAEAQQGLQQEQQQLSGDLQELVEKRPELGEAAKQSELEKLKRLAELAEAIAEPQDMLADALNTGIPELRRELARKQNELSQDAESLVDETDKSDGRKPRESVDVEQLKQTVDDLELGNLEEALEKQKAATAELERLAQELEKNASLPIDPQQAVRELAKRQEAIRKRIANSAKKKPLDDAPEAAKEAFKQTQRALATEQTALEAGLIRLQLPHNDRAAQRQTAATAADVAKDLRNNDQKAAERRAQQVKASLDRLAQAVGTEKQRRTEAAREVAQLRREQASLSREVSQKSKQTPDEKQLEAMLKPLAQRQEQIARKIADITPTTEQAAQDEAFQRSAQAKADLQDGKTEASPASQAEAEKALAHLEKKLKGEALPEEQVAAIRKKQQNVQKAANQAAAASNAGALKAQAQQQKKIAAELAKLDAPAGEQQKQAAKQAADQAARTMQQKQSSKEQAEQALKRVDDALQQLADAVTPQPANPSDAAETLAQQQQQAREQAAQAAREQLAQGEADQKNAAARKAAALAKQQQASAEQAANAAKNEKPKLEAVREQAREKLEQRAQQTAGLDVPEPSQAAQADAVAKLKQASNAQAAGDDAVRQLETDTTSELLKQDVNDTLAEQAAAEKAAAEALTGLSNQLAEEAKKPVAPPTKPAPQPQTNAAVAKQATQAQDLADRQRALAQEVAQAMAEAAAQTPPPTQTADAQPAPSPASKAEQAAMQQAAQTAQQRQRELAQEAADLALDAARETGRQSEAARQSAQLARQATQASQQALVGELAGAAKTAEEAAQTAQQATEAAQSATRDNPNSDLAQRAEALANEQAEIAQALAEMGQSQPARAAAQQRGQQQLAAAAQQLSQGLSKTAERLGADPLNLGKEGQQATTAQKSVEEGREAMQQSSQQQQQGQAAPASQSARQAAQSLRDAARQALGAAIQRAPKDTPVPNEVGEQVVDAAEQLRDAQQQLAQAMQPPGDQTAQANGEQSGEKGESQQGQPGQGEPSDSMSESAKSLQDAAEALAQAAQKLQPGQGQQGASSQGQQPGMQQPSDQLQDGQMAEASEFGEGNGATVTVDLTELEIELKKLAPRQWGQLPGTLRTEILQAVRKRPNGDYAKLIRMYFEEISRARTKSQEQR